MVPGMMPGLTGVTGSPLTGLTGMGPKCGLETLGTLGNLVERKETTREPERNHRNASFFIHFCRFDLISVLPACFISGF